MFVHFAVVNGEVGALDLHRHLDPQGNVQAPPVTVQARLGAVAPIGHGGHHRAGLCLGLIPGLGNAVIDGFQGIALVQLGQAPGTQLASGNLGAQVAQGRLRKADVVLDHLPHAIVASARLVQLDRAHLNALVKNFVGLHIAKTGAQAPHIHPVGAVGGKSHHLALVKAGCVDDHIVQVLATHARMVHDHHVTGRKAVQAIAFDAVLNRQTQVGQKDRQPAFVLANHASLHIDQAAAKVAHLVNHHVVGRLAQRQGHFFRIGDERMGHHLLGDRVDRACTRCRYGCVHAKTPWGKSMSMMMWPCALMRARSPGKTKVVELGSSITAGPVTSNPAGRLGRHKMRADTGFWGSS